MKPSRWFMAGGLLLVLGLLAGYGIWSNRPSREQLLAATRDADRLVVLTANLPGHEYGSQVFEIRGADQVREVAELIDLEDVPALGTSARCRCDGNYHLNFYRGDAQVLSLEYHHGRMIRWPGGPWGTDVKLTTTSQKALPRWFQKHGFPGLAQVVNKGL